MDVITLGVITMDVIIYSCPNFDDGLVNLYYQMMIRINILQR